MDKVEKAFSNFLESYEGDKIMNDYFSLVRMAFICGYKAAGGNAEEAHSPIRLLTPLPDIKKNV